MSRRLVGVIAGISGAVMVFGGAAYAAIPNSSTGVITACYATSGSSVGLLKVIDAQAGAVCAAGQIKVTWPSKGLVFKGAWSNATAYKVNDVVTYRGGVLRCPASQHRGHPDKYDKLVAPGS